MVGQATAGDPPGSGLGSRGERLGAVADHAHGLFVTEIWDEEEFLGWMLLRELERAEGKL
jgi:hypothetical protein